MPDIPPLETFGSRIMICGPSNSGKSTLAAALARKLGIELVHLDLLRHLPDTNWVQRPDEEFAQLHDEAIEGLAWVMDGNYSKLMPARRERTTGIILLSDNRWRNMYRYFRRTLFEKDRIGALTGNKDSIKLDMIRWVWIGEARNVRRYSIELPRQGVPFLHLRGMRELNQVYRAWKLTRG
jgi:adenylate kinase family enzyme